MIQRTNQVLFAYWNEVRAGRIAPRRFEIEPARIGSILSETFILERLSFEAYRYRLAGTKLCEEFGQELRGRNFLDQWPQKDRVTLEREFAAMTERGGVGILTFDAATSDGRHASFEAIILPLVHTHDKLDRYLGAVAALNPPAWLGQERLVQKSLLRAEMIWPDGRPFPVVDKARNQSPFLPEMRNARLVRSNRRQFRVYDGGRAAEPREKR